MVLNTSTRIRTILRTAPARGVLVLALIALVVVLLTRMVFVPANRAHCHRNLAIIGTALREYHATYGSFPPAVITDQSGKRMHSWRVLLLPFLSEESLYRSYRFDEPWNGPHNIQLSSRCPAVYSCPSDWRGPEFTSYVAVLGDQTHWSNGEASPTADPVVHTMPSPLVVEFSRGSIVWTEPNDGILSSPWTDSFGGNHAGGGYALMRDGFVRWVEHGLW